MKLIDLHKEWMELGHTPRNTGLCSALPQEYRTFLDPFRPTDEEKTIHELDGWCCIWWGERMFDIIGTYTDFRQTIVLLICAMNNEL